MYSLQQSIIVCFTKLPVYCLAPCAQLVATAPLLQITFAVGTHRRVVRAGQAPPARWKANSHQRDRSKSSHNLAVQSESMTNACALLQDQALGTSQVVHSEKRNKSWASLSEPETSRLTIILYLFPWFRHLFVAIQSFRISWRLIIHPIHSTCWLKCLLSQ